MHELASVAIKVIGVWYLAAAVYDGGNMWAANQFDDVITHWAYFPTFVEAMIGLVLIWGTKGCLFVINVPVPEATEEVGEDGTHDDSN